MVLLGFPGVQALDLVGPFDVFTGATVVPGRPGPLRRRLRRHASSPSDGEPVSTGTGLEIVAKPLPDPRQPSTPSSCPAASGPTTARRDDDAHRRGSGRVRRQRAARRQRLHRCVPRRRGRSARRLPRPPRTGRSPTQLAANSPPSTVDPEPIFVRSSREGVDGGRASPRASTWRCRSSRTTTAPRSRRPSPAGWCSTCAGPAARRSSPRRCGCRGPNARRSATVQEAIESEPGGAHSVPDLARRAAMSPRHFTRVFTDEVGEAPGAYVERIRTEAARRQLEETDDTVTVIAARCGFGTAETMRRNFVRRIGHLARPVPQDLRLRRRTSCRSPSCSTPASPRWTSSAPTRCCAGCPTPRSGSSGTSPARSPPTPACWSSAPPTRSTRPPRPTSFWCPAASPRSSTPATRRCSTGCARPTRPRRGRRRCARAR